MNGMKMKLVLGALFVLFILLINSVYAVHQTQQALIVQFGKPVAVIQSPGLKFKVPFIQRVQLFDTRVLDYNAEPIEVPAADNKRLVIDAYVRYRITDPLRFFLTVNNPLRMNERLKPILDSALREAVSRAPLNAVISTARARIMQDVKEILNKEMANVAEGSAAKEVAPVVTETGDTFRAKNEGFGIEIIDVRLVRADLPAANSEAIFNRMRTGFEREAKELRARGEEDALKIRGKAEKERTLLIAEAEKQAQVIRGEGDGKATKIAAEAFGQDPEFYSFYRSLAAYRNVLSSQDTTVIMSPGDAFLKHFSKE